MSGEHMYARFTAPAAQVDATNGSGGPFTATTTAGDYYIDEFCDELATQLNAACPSGWSVLFDDTTGQITIDCSDRPFSIAFTSVPLRDLIGFAADIVAAGVAQVGTKQVKGFWIADCPLMLDGDPSQAPTQDDGRASESPTGLVYKVTGVTRRRHRNLRFSHVERSRVWASAAVLENADYETFYLDTQAGVGHAWFRPASRVRIFWGAGGILTRFGGSAVDSWQLPNPTGLDELPLAAPPMTALVTVILGDAKSNE